MRFTGIALVPALLLLLAHCGTPTKTDDKVYSGDKFNEHIRTTEARNPEEERLGFKLPEGFEVTCFASEPQIGKPINIAFDAKGRLWVTQSFEYPFPAKPGNGKDKLTILEDTDQDGKADKFTVFSDTLNIPIGILPTNDGAIAYSIPNVYKYTDADGDGKADGQQVLLGPFKTHDTHGMINNFVRGYDGWVHSCHGYTNRDTVAGTDGHSISMISGNTFRFRADGSRAEKTTDGRINPFGLVYDERGYLYSTDCHTSPLYQLMRNADYTQWGKEEGMGFAPDMTPLSDEATALAGIAYYADKLYPESFHSNFFVGDVVRCRVFRYSASFDGSTPKGKREEDFMLSEDPWFRPVDVKMGPDGAIYIADFYNSIIGHYEVPLDHPKRDHVRGRIWRITYKGKHNENKDWTKAALNELVQALDMNNMFVRMTAADQLADRIGQPAAQPVSAVLNEKEVSTQKYVHALWVLQRLNALPPAALQAAAAHTDPVIRLHAMHIVAEQKPDQQTHWPIITKALEDKDQHVRRAAVELLAQYPSMQSLQLALAARQSAPAADNHLLYAARLSARNMLRNESLMKEAAASTWNEQDMANISDVLMGVYSQDAGVFLHKYLELFRPAEHRMGATYQHAARFMPDAQLNNLVTMAVNGKYPDSVGIYIFRGIEQGISQRGGKVNAQLEAWGKKLAENILLTNTFAKENSIKLRQLQQFAADIAGRHKIASVAPKLEAILQHVNTPDFKNNEGNESVSMMELKTAALRALINIDTKKGAVMAQRVLTGADTYPNFKTATSRILGEFPPEIVAGILNETKNLPPDIQQNMAYALSGTPKGKDILFVQIRNNNFFPRTLLEPRVRERIFLNITPAQKSDFEKLTAGIDPVDRERQLEIEAKLAAFESAMRSPTPPSVDSGKMVFTQFCSSCHSIDAQGGNIGPNLNGVAQWGPKALSEKILDPNRNISENFKMYTIRMKDGKVQTGLYRREEGAVIIFADLTGKEFSISKKDIAEQTASKLTLMPDNFRQTLSQKDYNALIHFLMNPKNEKK